MKIALVKYRIRHFINTITGSRERQIAVAEFYETVNKIMWREFDKKIYRYCDLYIKEIKVNVNPLKVTYKIVIDRPGVFIGKGGRVINSIKETLSNHLENHPKVEISIKEWKNPWDWNNVGA